MMAPRGPGMRNGHGLEVDIETGMPVEERESAQREKTRNRQHEQVSRAQYLKTALQDPAVARILEEFQDVLAQRIDELVASDAQCQGLLRVVAKYQSELSLGRQASKALMKPLYDVSYPS